jgi:hypothetical protein
MRILPVQPFTRNSHLNPFWKQTNWPAVYATPRRIDADAPGDQAGDEKGPMSTQKTRSQDENRLAKEG